MRLDRPFVWFDTETTGPEPETDRVVEIGLVQFKPDGTELEWSTLVNPGVPIPAEATYGNPLTGYTGHGITDEMVKDAPRFGQLAPALLRMFSQSDYGGYGIKRFDLPLMRAEFAREGKEWSWDGARVVDGVRLWQLGEPRTLGHASKRFLNREHEGAHRTIADIRTAFDVAMEQVRQFGLPSDLDALHAAQWPVDPNAIDPDGKIVWKDGVATMNFGKSWKGLPLDKMTKRNLSWIAYTATGCSRAVKDICIAALDGRFPRRTDEAGHEAPAGPQAEEGQEVVAEAERGEEAAPGSPRGE